MSAVSRLCLGCAKFEISAYPPGSASPQPTPYEAEAILWRAYELGIRHFDCARRYGQSEDLIEWTFGSPLLSSISVTSKTAPEYFVQARLRSPFRPLILHNPTVAQLWLYQNMADGASVNNPTEATVAIAAGYKHLQFPHWALDQRYAESGIFESARKYGVATYARQPFGRGLLVSDPQLMAVLGQYGFDAHCLIGAFRLTCARHQLTPVEAALRFALESPADYVVFGVASIAQLQQVITLAQSDPPDAWEACYADLRETFRTSHVALASVCTPGR